MRYKAYKYRIYPNKGQQELINKHIGCCRFVYNLCLEKKINAYKTSKKSISCFELINLLPSLKKEQETSFLKEVSAQSLQAAIRNLDSAYQRFFKEKKDFQSSSQKGMQNNLSKLFRRLMLTLMKRRFSFRSLEKALSVDFTGSLMVRLRLQPYQEPQQDDITYPYW